MAYFITLYIGVLGLAQFAILSYHEEMYSFILYEIHQYKTKLLFWTLVGWTLILDVVVC